jgi:hypothetical protein
MKPRRADAVKAGSSASGSGPSFMINSTNRADGAGSADVTGAAFRARDAGTHGSASLTWSSVNAAWVWLPLSEYAGGFVRPWRHLPLRGPAPGGLAATRGPARCDIVPVLTGTMSHRAGCGAVAGAAAARREGPPGSARREGCARSRRRPACLRRPATHSRGATATRHPCRITWYECCWSD